MKHNTLVNFPSGDSDRGASIRIPIVTAREGKGQI